MTPRPGATPRPGGPSRFEGWARRASGLSIAACVPFAVLGPRDSRAEPTSAQGGPDTAAWVAAARAELERARTGLHIEGQPAPYFVSYDLVTGSTHTAAASDGVLTAADAGPYDSARIEVRVGDPALDNTNFSGGFSGLDGVTARGLPTERSATALRRELWLGTDEAYKGALEQYSAKLAARQGDQGEHPPDLAPATLSEAFDPTVRPTASADDVRGWVEGLTALCRGHELESCTAIARDWQGTRATLTTEGTSVVQPTGYVVVRVEAVARTSDGGRVRDLRSWIARDHTALPDLDTMKRDTEAMLAWVDSARSAPVLDDYLGPVLLEDTAAVDFFSQLLLAELSGTPPEAEGRDAFTGLTEIPPTARLGRRLLPAGWSVTDDASRQPASAGAYAFDFEGVRPRAVTLVEDGVVQDLLMSRVPREGLLASTGHGRSIGTDRRVAVPSVVSVEPRRSVGWQRLVRQGRALARQAHQGELLVLRRLEPVAMAEDFDVAFSGDAPLAGLTRPLEAYLLAADGTITPVRGLRTVGVDRRVLRDIVAAGHTADAVDVLDASPGSRRYAIGSVGGIPSAWAVPAVLLGELELRGSDLGEPRVLTPPVETVATAQTPAG